MAASGEQYILSVASEFVKGNWNFIYISYRFNQISIIRE